MTSEGTGHEPGIDDEDLGGAGSTPAERARLNRLMVLGTFALGVAHELSTPISSLEMTARFAVETADSERRQQLLRTIVRDAERCRLIFESLSRFVLEGILDKHDANASGIVRRCAQRVREEGGTLSVETLIAPDAQMVLCHAPALEQVLCEVMRNSVRAGGGSANVHVAVARRGDAIEIVCQDEGPGIDPAAMSHLFEPFYSTTPSPGAMGLGLTLARHIVVAHGGSIRAEPVPGRGARLVLELPASTMT